MDTADLPPDEAYVVTQLRSGERMLRPDPNNRPLMCSGPIPVCTYDTLFRMLGRGVLALDPTAQRGDRYELTPEWK